MKIRVPESVFRGMVAPTDGRRHDEVEVEVGRDTLTVKFTRTGESTTFSRKAYDSAIRVERVQRRRKL